MTINPIVNLYNSWFDHFTPRIFGAVGGLIGSLTGADELGAAGAEAAAAAKFQPTRVTGGVGTADITGEGITLGLDPRFQQISTGFTGAAGGLLGGFDPTQLLGNIAAGQRAGAGFLGQLGRQDIMGQTQDLFKQFESILNPERQRERAALEGRLLAQGRLGSTGGALAEQGFQEAIEQSRRQNLLQAFGQAQQERAQLAGLGQQFGLFGGGLPLELARGAAGAASALELLPAELAQLGLERSRIGTDAAARAAEFGLRGREGEVGAKAGVLGGLLGGLGDIF